MDSIRVATLNVWNKSGPWDRRLALIRREIGAIRPDVLGLQEVLRLGDATDPEHHQAVQVVDGLGYEVAYGAASDFGHGLAFGNAVASRFPIVESQRWELPGRESGETRSLLYARVHTPAGFMPVFVTHLNWKLHHGAVRCRQVRFVVDTVQRIAPTRSDDLPPVLIGDFNAEPDADEIRYLCGLATIDDRSVHFSDVWTFAGDGSAGATFDRRNRFAALAHERPRRIDYVFVRGPDRKLRGEPIRAALAFDVPDGEGQHAVWPSDHFGVVADLHVAPREATLDDA